MGKTEGIRGRFAPSPSGHMHLGNAFTALLAWLDVRALGGELVLRMEDLDTVRCRTAYLTQLADDLQWMGLDWDSGWRAGEMDFCQSHRTPYYDAALHALQGHLYPCYCTRKELQTVGNAPHATDGQTRYNGHCHSLNAEMRARLEAAGRRPAWRIHVPEQEICFADGVYGICQSRLDTDCGDFILQRSDGLYAYQLAVVVDDGEMGITRVVRGRDLLSSTPRQLWLMEQLGYEAPRYFHVPLLRSEDGRRLSKRDGALELAALRTQTTPERLIGLLAYLAGLIDRPVPLSARELIPLFSWQKVRQTDQVVTAALLQFLRGSDIKTEHERF